MTTLLLIAVASAAPVNTMTEVDGRKYRVEVKGDVVSVFNKAMVYSFSMEERDRQRKAVKQATGCEVADEYGGVAIGRLEGRLACPAKPPSN